MDGAKWEKNTGKLNYAEVKKKKKVEERKQEMGRDRGDEKILALLFFPWNPPPCHGLVSEMQFLPIDWSVPPRSAGPSSLSKSRRRRKSSEHKRLQAVFARSRCYYAHFSLFKM